MKTSIVLYCQSVYYFATGLWPVIHINSFLVVSGDKTDLWLVKMVGLLTVAVAITLAYCASKFTDAGRVLGICAAIAYTIVDVYYYFSNVIPAIYLADAVVELIIILLLIIAPGKGTSQRTGH